MKDKTRSTERILESLHERAKELNCLYQIEELLNKSEVKQDEACWGIVEVIPPAWQYPDVCQAKITIEGKQYVPNDFKETPWMQSADVIVQERVAGTILVCYTQEMPHADDGPFLKEETKLLQTITDRLGLFLLHNRLKQVYQDWHTARDGSGGTKREEWQVILDLLKQTDKELFIRLSHKMLNYLCWSGIKDAEHLLKNSNLNQKADDDDLIEDSNIPYKRQKIFFPIDLSTDVFRIASEHLKSEDIFGRIQKWIQEDKLSFLVQVVNRNLSLSDVADAIRRYYYNALKQEGVVTPNVVGILVSLIRRFLSDQLQYINIAKNCIEINDFYQLIKRMVFSSESHGKLGGKSAGMYLASQIIKKNAKPDDSLSRIKIPKTWYITSDMILYFMHYNNLDEIVEQKYKEIDEVRFEFPNIIHSFKNSFFPPEMIKGLSVALDEFDEKPLIVRSSSLLEDRLGAVFSGKYKSVFIANQGSKKKRLEALLDAIAEVYASTFGPDPIEYRKEKELIDFGEEMGIMIQEVVGTRVGDYFLPLFAGVAFSRNEFRWSPRIKRDDGLVRLVPGLGTRAVDRLSDDYPILCAPGQPGLRVNISNEDIIRYSPTKVDVINLVKGMFETVEVSELLKEFGYDIPMISKLVSIHKGDHIQKPAGASIDFDNDDLVVTFEGLISNSKFIEQMQNILKILEKNMGNPVDIEFAHDGKDLYLLQCRPQSSSGVDIGSPIPKDIPEDKIVFSANRYVSNGKVPDITHIIYVDPDAYSRVADRDEMVTIGKVIGRLNKLLPKRQFILMGPGRWGSRGDIKLGVRVTYSEINNTAVLIEIARKKGNYIPDLSFGTHFFQDLVEANIRYLPLYPDDEGVVFNERFLLKTPNLLKEILPEYENIADVIHVIDVPKVSNGMILRVLLNAELDEAVGLLTNPASDSGKSEIKEVFTEHQADSSWRWRLHMAENIASLIDPEYFGVKGVYVIGSTKNASAQVSSDIDLLIHFSGTDKQREILEHWLEGWSLCLDRINYLRTGYKTGGLLDVHIITDDDIREKNSYACKIGAITDSARPLQMKKNPNPGNNL